MKKILGIIIASLSLVACETTTIKNVVDPSYTTKPLTGGETTQGLDYRDFEFTSKRAVDSFLASPLSVKPNSNQPWIMAISRIKNDTTLDIDTDQLVKKIRIAMLNSGRVMTTTAIAAGGAEDEMTKDIRTLEKSKLFDKSTVAKQGTVIAPDLSLSGKIIQRTNKVAKNQQIDYYFQLTVTNLQTGLAYWEFEEIISKVSTNNSFSWSP